MDRQRHARVSEIFLAAADLPPAERTAFLERICDGDADLRREVEELLARDAAPAAFETITIASKLRRVLEENAEAAAGAPLPERIGPYEILGVLGEGGMGTVYRARQAHPARVVALKVLNAAYLSPALLKRFEFEAQVLAELQHPGIAQIFDAGVADARGAPIPFYAMELVQGQTLTAHAAARRLDHRARLALLRKVCDAVQHAHQKGVIHRDLKPANILVTDAGEPKILDFGVARAATAGPRSTTLLTQPGQIIGTLPYMSPEQVSGNPQAIDIRSDIYALGVIAYELLSGRLPLPMEGRSLPDAVRLIEAGDPVQLSRHDRALGGDVETIVHRALHKDAARRYPSAAELSREIERYLADEPIEARRDSSLYILRKTLARYRAAVVVGCLFALVLAVATTIAIVSAVGEAKQRRLAEQHAHETRKVADFQAQMLRGVDIQTMGRDLKAQLREQIKNALERQYVGEGPERRKQTPEEIATTLQTFDELVATADTVDVARQLFDRQILDRAAQTAATQFADQPLVQARLYQTLGSAYGSIGIYEAAERQLRTALDIQRRELGSEHPDLIETLQRLGLVLHYKEEHAAAEPLYREALALCRRRFGPDAPRTGQALADLAAALSSRGDYAAAEPMFREALALLTRLYGAQSAEVAVLLSNFGEMLGKKGDFAGAETSHREALAMRRALLGNDNLEVATSLNNLANVLASAGRYAEAEPLQREALGLFRKLLGDEHPHTVSAFFNLANTLRPLGALPEAESLAREAVALHRKIGGDADPSLAYSLTALGLALQERGDLDGAERLLREVLALVRAQHGERHPHTATALNNLAVVFHMKRNHAAAEPLYRQALGIRRQALGPDHPDVAPILNNLAAVLRDREDFVAAERFYREAVLLLRNPGGSHSDLAGSLSGLGLVLHRKGQYAEAEAAQREALQIQLEILPPAHGRLQTIKTRLLRTLVKLGRYAEAEELVPAARGLLDQPAAAPSPDTILTLETLIELYDARHAAEPDKGYETQAAAWRAKLTAAQTTTQPATRPTAP